MFDIKYKIESDIIIHSFELKNAHLFFNNHPVFIEILKDNTDLTYLLRRQYWIDNKKPNYNDGNIRYDRETIRIEHPSFFIFDDYYGNYLHYFVETFPKINYFLQIKEKIPNIKLTIPNFIWEMSFIKESILMYLDNDISDVVVLDNSKNYIFDMLLIPSNIYLWPDKFAFSNIILDSFKKLSDKVTVDDEKTGVYISRQDTIKLGWWHKRHLVNELELIENVKTDLNYDIVELYYLNLHDKIKIFKTYKNILQTSGAGMINLLACKPLTNFHIISNPLYKWSDPILKIAAKKLNVNFYEYDSAKVIYETEQIVGDESNRPWKLENIEKIISKIKTI